MGVILTTYFNWDDPPSGKNEGLFTKDFFGRKKYLPSHPGDEAAS